MHIFWLNGGLYIRPEDQADRVSLDALASFLDVCELRERVPRGFVGNAPAPQAAPLEACGSDFPLTAGNRPCV